MPGEHIPRYAQHIMQEHVIPTASLIEEQAVIPIVDKPQPKTKKRRVTFNKFVRRRTYDGNSILEDVVVPVR